MSSDRHPSKDAYRARKALATRERAAAILSRDPDIETWALAERLGCNPSTASEFRSTYGRQAAR
jgi:hypothetical protein